MNHEMHFDKVKPNTGALDMRSLLEAPAGTHGFVQARDGHLYFEDGKRARFIGFNIAARSNTPTHETAEKLAERFASLGVNVIRLHAADAKIGDEPCSWSACREAPLLDYESGSSRNFNVAGLDRYDYLVHCLREKGVYMQVDLHVARAFMKGDGLPSDLPDCLKSYGMVNEKLIELQQEYASNLLTHVNPYTGLSLIDDPAVMCVQINNEDSVIKEHQKTPETAPYEKELQEYFGRFLLAKYGSREALKEAWSFEGVSALADDEDPAEGTVRTVDGSFVQPVNDPLGSWDGSVSPARYADFMDFGIEMNRRYYRRMKEFLRTLGVKVPINTSNLLGGAADVCGHTDADLMENNSYFNHPLLPTPGPKQYIAAGPTEYASVNPLTMQRGIGALATSLVSLGSEAAVAGKPFALSEWNEYGLHPFHSTSFLSTIAYACLNDWDGLMIYNYHTSENSDDQPDDEIINVFDCYNDAALIAQWHFLASVFLKGLVSPAKSRVDLVYTPGDLETLPNGHAMMHCFLPYVTGFRNVFEDGDAYCGTADAAVNAGFVNACDLSGAPHGVYYSWSFYRDAFRRFPESKRLPSAAEGSREIAPGVHLGKNLVIDDLQALAGAYDYREIASHVTKALQEWGVLPEGTGYTDGKLVSDTGELTTDPENTAFRIRSSRCAGFSGKPGAVTVLTPKIIFKAVNDRLTLTLLPEDSEMLDGASSFLFTAVGKTGMTETALSPVEAMPGIPFSLISMQGKLYAETAEGTLFVEAPEARLELLDPNGAVLSVLHGEPADGGVYFTLDGSIPSINWRLIYGDRA